MYPGAGNQPGGNYVLTPSPVHQASRPESSTRSRPWVTGVTWPAQGPEWGSASSDKIAGSVGPALTSQTFTSLSITEVHRTVGWVGP